MAAIFHVTAPMPEGERNRRIYAGEILVFQGFAAVGGLVDCLRDHCRAHLGPDPERAHERMSQAQINDAAEALCKAVLQDATVATRLNDVFRAIGMDLETGYGDGLKQRVQMARSQSGGRMVAPLAAHRDTWGSNIAAQTNWWAPVFATTPERTIALFPAYFERAVANNSAAWDFAELVRRLKHDGPDPDYPLLPLASERPPRHEALPISLAPGELLCFSGAHLHASVSNETERTRLSFETRTVNGADAVAGPGAPNVDGRAPCMTLQMFKRLTDGRKLGKMQRIDVPRV